MLSAGQRNHRVRFQRRVVGAKSASGNVLEQWLVLFDRWAGLRPQFGREQVASGRLESSMLGTLTVLSDPETAGIAASDRVLFIAGPYRDRTFEIVSIIPTADGREIEMTLRSSDGTT